MIDLDRIERDAEAAYGRADYPAVIALATQLVRAGEPWMTSGYLLRGWADENLADASEKDLENAIADFRRLAILAPGTPSLLNLARTLMKQGPTHYPAAWAFLGEASAMDHTPEVDLGFAEYHLGAPSGDLRLAQQHFLRAAMAGRFKGFFGYARASRLAGQPGRALLADCLRVVLGPLLWLLLGEKAQYQF